MSGRRLVLVLEIYTDEQGKLDAKVDTDLSPADAANLIGVVMDQIDPTRDRADEVEAWGARRRH